MQLPKPNFFETYVWQPSGRTPSQPLLCDYMQVHIHNRYQVYMVGDWFTSDFAGLMTKERGYNWRDKFFAREKWLEDQDGEAINDVPATLYEEDLDDDKLEYDVHRWEEITLDLNRHSFNSLGLDS